jgi:hypothetical protein
MSAREISLLERRGLFFPVILGVSAPLAPSAACIERRVRTTDTWVCVIWLENVSARVGCDQKQKLSRVLGKLLLMSWVALITRPKENSGAIVRLVWASCFG